MFREILRAFLWHVCMPYRRAEKRRELSRRLHRVFRMDYFEGTLECTVRSALR